LLRQVGYHEQPIQVRRFYLPEYQLGIRDLPKYLEDFVVNPDACLADLSEEDKQLEAHELSASLAEWLKQGSFVFHHDDEYWMDAEGFVLAH
jgi:hypothetical protein